VMRAKGELYEYLQDSGGKVFVNCGDQMLMDMLMNFPGEVIRYGNGEGTICSGGIDKTDPFLHIHVNPGNMPGNRINIRTRMLGDFNLENILAAVGVGYYFDVNVERIMEAVSEYIPDMLRSQILKSRHNTLFVDAYNANPTSMLAAIRNFQKNAGENKMLILGEMAELGEVSEAEHIALVSHIVESGIKRVILIGKSFLKLSVPEEFIRFNDVQAMVEWLHAHPIRNADILLKGSRIVGLEKLIQYL
jgi:UDP-N-acetylmuramoyl-tripeptide--D-alanyl-D-alanine ligase